METHHGRVDAGALEINKVGHRDQTKQEGDEKEAAPCQASQCPGPEDVIPLQGGYDGEEGGSAFGEDENHRDKFHDSRGVPVFENFEEIGEFQ